ncbi:MAG: hypothetical protein WDA42_02060 [Candidatus Bathyarchaeia archaeon]
MPENTDAQQLLQALSEKLMIIRLHISYPKLQRGIKDAIVEIPGAGEISAELRNAPSWQLLPREWREQYQAIDTSARKYLHSQSVQPKASGRVKSPILVDLDIIPLHKAEEIFNTLGEYATQMQTVHDAFVEIYDELLDNLRDTLSDTVFDTLAGTLPTKKSIRDMAGITWGILPINSGQVPNLQPIITQLSEIQQKLPVGADLTEVVDNLTAIQTQLLSPTQLDTHAAKFAAEASRKQLQSMAESLAETVFTAPRQAFADGVKHLMESINGGKQIRNGTLDIVRRACDTLRNFDFVADDVLLSQLDQVEMAIADTTVKELNSNEELGKQLASVLENAYNKANDKIATVSSLTKFRRIRHD